MSDDGDLDLATWRKKYNLRDAPKRLTAKDLMPCPECKRIRICNDCKARIERVAQRAKEAR